MDYDWLVVRHDANLIKRARPSPVAGDHDYDIRTLRLLLDAKHVDGSLAYQL